MTLESWALLNNYTHDFWLTDSRWLQRPSNDALSPKTLSAINLPISPVSLRPVSSCICNGYQHKSWLVSPIPHSMIRFPKKWLATGSACRWICPAGRIVHFLIFMIALGRLQFLHWSLLLPIFIQGHSKHPIVTATSTFLQCNRVVLTGQFKRTNGSSFVSPVQTSISFVLMASCPCIGFLDLEVSLCCCYPGC